MASARLCSLALSAPTTTLATPSVAVRRAKGSAQQHDWPVLPDSDSHEPQGVTVTSGKEYLEVELLTYGELLNKDGMEEEADVFTLYMSLFRVATDINHRLR